jgi:flagellar biosynthesis component FlhA
MVEMAEALVPATEAADKDWSFIKNDMAQLRASIQSEMGVEIPSILVRPNQYLTGFEYQFVLEEIPVIRYVETPGTIEATLQEAIVHLKSFLLKNLSYFINLDFVFNLLQDWKKSDNDAATIINQLFADDPKKLNRFTKLIQRLFNEMVPVTDWRSLLISANHTGLLQDDVHIDVREARLALKPYLPGNTKDIKTLLLDNNLRSWIIDNLKIKNNKYYFTATPNDTQDWLNNFRDLIATYQQEIIIVIDDNDARPFLKKVIQLEFPAIPVMAQNEFMTDEEIKNWHDKKLTAAGSIDLPTTS